MQTKNRNNRGGVLVSDLMGNPGKDGCQSKHVCGQLENFFRSFILYKIRICFLFKLPSWLVRKKIINLFIYICKTNFA